MIIGTKRRDEIIPRSQFRYKIVWVFHAAAAEAFVFTTKTAARNYLKSRKSPHVAVRIDETGWPSIEEASREAARVAKLFGHPGTPSEHNYRTGVHVDAFLHPTGAVKSMRW